MISNSMWSWWSELTGNKEELTLALLAISIITVVVSWYRSRKHTFPLPPGPRGLPVVGYLPFLDVNLHHEFTKMAQRYGPIFKLKLGSKTHIVVSSSDLAKVVVREQDDIFANRDPPVTGIAITYGGQSIVWSNNNSQWRNMRKVFAYEVLSNKNLEASQIFRRGEVRKTVKRMYETMGTEVDIGGITFLSSLNVVTSMMWGKSLVDEEKSKDLGVELREVISKIVELLGTANVSDLFPVVARLDLQGLLREMKRQKKVLEGIFDRIMNERIATKVEEGGEQAGRKDFLQILLELKGENTASSFTFDQIKGLFTEIITGGTDTTSTMAEWIMAELLQNPKILKMVQDELEEVVGLSNIVEESHISKLYYLDAVIKETFRLHPPLPLLITRCPNQSCSVGGYTVPKGANVYLNVWAIHRNPEYWDNPLEFNPKRFINPDGTSKYDYNGYNFNYIPFGSGRRKCPGVRLGEKMLVYLLASLLHSFNWTLPTDKEHDLSDKFGIVLKKRKPLIAIPSQRLSDKNLYE
ncbi:7-ethoxycoumarin O-deethylase-like [Cynara cardunculus var. scolymus]|uniref:7-ethoxycoumarin O-deethylase-like n=1 Tax=Cynara cardunculus var. scolymus TaxID=59895 RepID=UPI000D62395C|nr:7-ethoxycoumarin O-deethylase-like [Cynara cardunculus var. scolymus]